MGDTYYIGELKRRLAKAEVALRGRAAAEAAQREADQKYRTMFDLIDEGFCVVEVIGGEGGEPIDYRFLETNASFERQTGLVDAIGRRMRELEPLHEEHWFERYARVAQTREPERFEDRADALGRWYDVYAFPVGDPGLRLVGILFRDTIERKRAEEELARLNALLRTTILPCRPFRCFSPAPPKHILVGMTALPPFPRDGPIRMREGHASYARNLLNVAVKSALLTEGPWATADFLVRND